MWTLLPKAKAWHVNPHFKTSTALVVLQLIGKKEAFKDCTKSNSSSTMCTSFQGSLDRPRAKLIMQSKFPSILTDSWKRGSKTLTILNEQAPTPPHPHPKATHEKKKKSLCVTLSITVKVQLRVVSGGSNIKALWARKYDVRMLLYSLSTLGTFGNQILEDNFTSFARRYMKTMFGRQCSTLGKLAKILDGRGNCIRLEYPIELVSPRVVRILRYYEIWHQYCSY